MTNFKYKRNEEVGHYGQTLNSFPAGILLCNTAVLFFYFL